MVRRLTRSTTVVGISVHELVAGPAWAHGLVERYTLPIPLWLYLVGAGAAVAVSFAGVVLYRRGVGDPGAYPRTDLLRVRVGRLMAHPALLSACRLAAVALFGLVVVAGLLGRQSPFHNIAPVLVWVVFWVGLSFASALLGDVWAFLNPWRILFRWGERLVTMLLERPPGPARRWPPWLGVWPAVVLLFAFAWMELVWAGRDRPRSLALAILAYSGVTWIGMLVFGREPWLRGGEVFSVVFGLLARFAPTEIRVTNPALCRACASPECRGISGGCVNCAECFARAAAHRQLNLRPPAVGLLAVTPLHPSAVALVLLLLSTVTFDGIVETPAWAAVEAAWTSVMATAGNMPSWVPPARWPVLTVGLSGVPVVFLGLYALTTWRMSRAVGEPGRPGSPSAMTLARRFVPTLLPIAIGYHVAHYLPFLLLAGQLVIPLASDPLGLGWDLFGTSLYRVDVAIMDARLIWYSAVAAIVAGHVLAVYLAHVTALHVFGDPRAALRSQYPMLVLMVGYTMLSLWILAQPVVQP